MDQSIIAYQFSGFKTLFTKDDSDMFWIDGCALKLFMSHTAEDFKHIVAKWEIRLKNNTL